MIEAPDEIYRQQVRDLTDQLKQLHNKQSIIGWGRLIVILITSVTAYQAFFWSALIGIAIVVIGITIFLILVSLDANNNRKISNIKNLIKINEDELLVLANQFQHRYDGRNYLIDNHAYAADMDVFGSYSLYQFINRCNTEQGRQLLANNFTSSLDVEEVKRRHEAIKELGPQYVWRQQLQALTLETPISIAMQKKIQAWVMQDEAPFAKEIWKWVLPFYAVITVSSAVATIVDWLPLPIFSFLFILYFIFSSTLSRKPTQAYLQLNSITGEVAALQQVVQYIESKEFNSNLLVELKQKLSANNRTAGLEIKEIKDILNRFDLRLNVFLFIILNSFFLWDVWQMRSLNNWKEKNKNVIRGWFNSIAEMEVLNSLSALHFNNRNWSFPTFSHQYFYFNSKSIGHPLIANDKRITSDFRLDGSGKVAIITGSNMAGKSTFLRSLGANTILAQMGAPVCAEAMKLSPVHLLSSMRILDNLAENTSTFYAELKKLKYILDEVNEHKPVFILLDEILRGTNSLDRHIGSKALIKQLIQEKAVAVIATHDVELSKLVEDYQNDINNYHFDVQVANEDELYFDYKLKDGVCTNLNASILMKKIGIKME